MQDRNYCGVWGPNLPRGAAGMLELQNVLNIKEFSEKN